MNDADRRDAALSVLHRYRQGLAGLAEDALAELTAALGSEIGQLREEVDSKSEQIGKLYKVCNERDVLRNIAAQSRHHIRAALGLNDDNRLALAVQGRRLLRDIDAAIGDQQLPK